MTEPRSPALLPHLPALDGLRGVAVGLVVAYHLEPGTLPGGFLGVDIFFVLSGFLLTSLAIREIGQRGGFRVGAFYGRRVRRLLPALLVLLLAVALYAAVWADPQELDRLRAHSLWTLGYLANWRFVADGTTYTDAVFGQSPLRHTWSLAIEEQFYIVFPLIVLGLGTALRWRAEAVRRALGAVAIVGALASAGWMASLWGGGSDPSRGYFGTDTRVHSLFVGVLLGVVLVGQPVRRGPAVRWVGAAALAGAIGLLVAATSAHESSSMLQHGGFLLVALATAAVIAGSEALPPLQWVLTRRPLVGLGIISYGVYLWHWPVIIVLDQRRTGLEGLPLDALRIAVTLAVALASFVLVERPIRRRRSTAGWPFRLPVVSGASAVAVASIVLVATIVPSVAPAPPRSVAAVDPEVAEEQELPIDLVMFGDSVARSLAGTGMDVDTGPPEQDAYDPTLVRVWNVARIYCSYLAGQQVTAGGQLTDPRLLCGNWRGLLADTLAADEYEVVLVALVNDASDRDVNGERVELGSERHAQLVADLIDELRSIARPHGTEVVLLALPPREDTFRTDLDRDGIRETRMRDELRQYVADHPDVRLLDLYEAICPAGDCDEPAGGFDPAWRSDGLHFSIEGARWVADWVTPQLLNLDAPTSSDDIASRSVDAR